MLNGKFSHLPISAMRLQIWGISFFFFSVSGQIMPRLQCKWTHSDSGSQNLDRTPGILVYGSFKTGQGLSGYLEPPPSKGCLPAEQPLDQLVAPVVFIYDESLICPWSGYWLCLCISACSPYFYNFFLICCLAYVLMSVSFLKYQSNFSIVYLSYVMGIVVSLELRFSWHWHSGPHLKSTKEYYISSWAALCWALLAFSCYTQGKKWPWLTGDGKIYRASCMCMFDPCWILDTAML